MPAMDAAELTLTIFSYSQNLAGVATLTQKTFNKNAWSLVQSQA